MRLLPGVASAFSLLGLINAEAVIADVTKKVTPSFFPRDEEIVTDRRIKPRRIYWGDTHVHTHLSADAYPMGTRTSPDDAYRFAKGERVFSDGQFAQLDKPLDFVMVSDHAENMGFFTLIEAGDPTLLGTAIGKSIFEKLKRLPKTAEILAAKNKADFVAGANMLLGGKALKNTDFPSNDKLKRRVWHRVIDVAEQHNEPGVFTTFAGYEYSSPGLHRTVLFSGGPEDTKTIIPFSSHDSENPEDLWSFLADYIESTGSGAISIPHNSNLSRGKMFSLKTFHGQPLDEVSAGSRSIIEPIVEVTQIKGDSETHPIISPNDDFASFENAWWDFNQTFRASDVLGTSMIDVANGSFVRGGLKIGLALHRELNVNPYKLGMIGSTDSHTGLATADEDNFWGSMATDQPSSFRASRSSINSASGHTAVWAEANTREGIFEAMKRREVYATTGPRIVVRFFGGWNFDDQDYLSPDIADLGYRKGVPMGGELFRQKHKNPPSFLIAAMKEPAGANLDRIQIVKGWVDEHGITNEQVYDVVWSGNRERDFNGKVPMIESTVDVLSAEYFNTVGSPALQVTWVDPDFDPEEASFYYVRVIAIPSPRWNTYDAARYGPGRVSKEETRHWGEWQDAPKVIQERAYSSPIWYSPKAAD